LARRYGEEERVIVAAVESEGKRVKASTGETGGERVRNRDDWDFSGVEAGADAAGGAETGEVGRETVGDIHHGGGDAAGGEPGAESDGDARVKMAAEEGGKGNRERGI